MGHKIRSTSGCWKRTMHPALCGERIVTRSIEHIQEAARKLADLATSEGEVFLAYLLQMAADEAGHRNVSNFCEVARRSLLEDCRPGI